MVWWKHIFTRAQPRVDKPDEESQSGDTSVDSASQENARVPQLADFPERITTTDEAKVVSGSANVLYDEGAYTQAIHLYDKVLNEATWLANPWIVKEWRAKAYCKAARFEEAERDLRELLDVLEKGRRVNNSKVMYWYLVARYKGDEKKAMSEFVNL